MILTVVQPPHRTEKWWKSELQLTQGPLQEKGSSTERKLTETQRRGKVQLQRREKRSSWTGAPFFSSRKQLPWKTLLLSFFQSLLYRDSCVFVRARPPNMSNKKSTVDTNSLLQNLFAIVHPTGPQRFCPLRAQMQLPITVVLSAVVCPSITKTIDTTADPVRHSLSCWSAEVLSTVCPSIMIEGQEEKRKKDEPYDGSKPLFLFIFIFSQGEQP